MKLFKTIKSKAKLFVTGAISVGAVAMLAVAASAEEPATTEAGITGVINSAGSTLSEQFSILVQTLVPVLIGIGVVGLGLYACVYLFKMAKTFFSKAAG